MIARLFFLLLFFSMTLMASAQEVVVERHVLRHIAPSNIAERFEILTSANSGRDANLKVQPDDETMTLIVTYQKGSGEELERQRLRHLTRDIITLFDQPQRSVTMFMYVVQTTLLNEKEFHTLHNELLRSPITPSRGTSPKGVIYWNRIEGYDQEVIPLQDIQGTMSGQILSGPTTVAGRIFPQASGQNISVFLELVIATESGNIASGEKEIKIENSVMSNGKTPHVFVSGPARPVRDGNYKTSPSRHELMVYLWAMPTADAPPLPNTTRK